jgi:hypothetical protein
MVNVCYPHSGGIVEVIEFEHAQAVSADAANWKKQPLYNQYYCVQSINYFRKSYFRTIYKSATCENNITKIGRL